MGNWAIIKTGGKQYKVEEGDAITVEKLDVQNNSVVFDNILAIYYKNQLKLGKPNLADAKVKAKILGNFKDKKIRVVKFKAKARYLRTTGHRQQKTKILIEKISS